MISQLYIKNVAVIKEINIEFTNGFNVFTGETGAGKSILVDSINAVLGNRTYKNIVRTGEKKAEITAVFSDNSDNVLSKLVDMDIVTDDEVVDEIIVTRTVTNDGKNTCKINGKPVTVTMLKEVGDLLIDIHGQRDNGYLLNESNHQKIIDGVGCYFDILKDYKDKFKLLVNKKKELDSLLLINNDKQYKIDILSHQINEIEKANVNEDFDEIKLLNDIKEYRNVSKINESLSNSYNALNNDSECSITSLMSLVKGCIDNISNMGEKYNILSEKVGNTTYLLEDISTEISTLLDGLDFSIDIDYLENRLTTVKNIKSKYGETVEEILNFYDKTKKELEQVKYNDDLIDNLENEAEKLFYNVTNISKKLTEKREETTKTFIKKIKDELVFLNMPYVEVTFKNDKSKIKSSGADSIVLLLSTNKGQEPQSISKVASGGELSRIMLSIKSLTVNSLNFKTMIFDEVDSGVSGSSANKIGKKLKEISKNSQVICITHSPQIAAFSDNHLKITKETIGNNTFTKVQTLSLNDRKTELARIISGDNITDTAINNAEEMINIANSI